MMRADKQNPRQILNLAQLRRWLIEPVAAVADYETRVKSRWLAAMLIIAVPFGFVMALLQPLTEGRSIWHNTHVPAMLALSLFLSLCYYLARQGRYQSSGFLAIVAAYVVIYLPSTLNGQYERLLDNVMFLIVPLVVSSVLLPPRITTLFLATNLVLVLSIPLVYPQIPLEVVLGQPVALMLVTYVLVSFGAYLRGALETYHMSILRREIDERHRVEDQLRISLREKETLLREIHHRVKNNLQIISSLLNLQLHNSQDPNTRAQLQDSQHRIHAMALIHERLYRSTDLGQIDMNLYLQALAHHLFRSYRIGGNRVKLTVEVESINLDIGMAIPCGLLVNELVANALKHAFPNQRAGVIGVTLVRDQNGQIQLTVWDDGVGLPPAMDWQNMPSLGLRLVNSLASQLGGSLRVCAERGTSFVIQFAAPQAESPPEAPV